MQIFMHIDLQPYGLWKDMSQWLGISGQPAMTEENIDTTQKRFARHDIPAHPPYVLVNHTRESWAVLHAEQFHSRPAHADQLHLDLWWHGLNLALDPGTFVYNAPPPWENSLASAFVHNTITVDGQEFMQRAGRFLYLDWAQAKVLDSHYIPKTKSHVLTASHDGYRKLGITHARTVTTLEDGNWEVEDHLDGPPGQSHSIRLHWLLPDWEYEVQDLSKNQDFPGFGLTLRSPTCKFTLQAGVVRQNDQVDQLDEINFQLARAGELLNGSGSVLPIAGYYSPTYGVKVPALSYLLEVKTTIPITLKSKFLLPRARAAVIIIKDNKLALIERHRSGKHYFVFAGGKIEPGETPKMAAARETMEELGLDVKIGRLVANIWFQGRPQYFFLAEETGGVFGHGTDPVMSSSPGSPRGTYQSTWMPVDELPHQTVLPGVIADLVLNSHHTGWPDTPLIVRQPPETEVI